VGICPPGANAHPLHQNSFSVCGTTPHPFSPSYATGRVFPIHCMIGVYTLYRHAQPTAWHEVCFVKEPPFSSSAFPLSEGTEGGGHVDGTTSWQNDTLPAPATACGRNARRYRVGALWCVLERQRERSVRLARTTNGLWGCVGCHAPSSAWCGALHDRTGDVGAARRPLCRVGPRNPVLVGSSPEHRYGSRETFGGTASFEPNDAWGHLLRGLTDVHVRVPSE
jgi:hypothetical protein